MKHRFLLYFLAYLPTLLLLALIIASLILYFQGWRFLVTPIPPTQPTPYILQVAT